MRTVKKLIVDASTDELREFIELTLQQELAATASRADMLAQMGPSWPAEFIYVEAAEDPDIDTELDEDVDLTAHQSLVSGRDKDDPIWKIRISSTALPGGDRPVPVAVNGSAKVIQRGLIADVPHRYILNLQNAVLESIRMDPKTKEFHRTKFTNYPLEILERPSRAEIDEWFERTKDDVLA